MPDEIPKQPEAVPATPISAVVYAERKYGPWAAVIVVLTIFVVALCLYIADNHSKVLAAFNRSTEASTKQVIMAEQVIKLVSDEAAEDRRWRETHR